MKIWIVWLPNVGKSTLFNALTKSYWACAENFPFCTIEPNIGIVNVNDDRLEKIAKTSKTQKIIPATAEFIDIAWIVEWASKWEWLGNKFLANIREVNVILQVVRVFENTDITHVSWNINPRKDIEVINSELILADLETIERRIVDNAKKARWSQEAMEAQKVYEIVKENLDKWKLAISIDLKDEEREHLKDLNLLTNKQFVYVANVNEDMMDIDNNELRKMLWITNEKIPICSICAKLEADMVDMSFEERKVFLEEMWLITTWIDDLIKTAYNALWLQYYFTSWEKETRAWTIHKWDKAPQAAWVIHTDFEKWFIKADVVNWKDFIEYNWWTWAREAWKVRLEGKDYVVQDGDIMLFKFSK